MDIKLEKKPWYIRYRYYLMGGLLFAAFLGYVVILSLGPRKLRIDAENVQIAEVKEDNFMSTELNSGTVGGFGHMGPNDPYNDGHSGSGSSGGSFNGGGNGGHDNSSGSSYTASFGLITGRHPITVPGTKNINSVDLSAVINNIIHHEGARNNMYLDTANNVTVGIGRMLPNSQAGYNLGFTKTHHIPRGHGDSEDVEISASHGDIDSAFNATKEKRASNVHLSDQSMVAVTCSPLISTPRC